MTIAHDNEENENDKHSADDHSRPFQNCFKPWQTYAAKQDSSNVAALEGSAAEVSALEPFDPV
ncbi:hypothetical protein [Synechococcus sp. MIT S9508]|uniref:hypothetical protein n=1 Tax=Synechococcus sp. MIT S9508 TaxID=1801629 RepID=UPI0012E9252F|nr:hypothetical protein [Synechococcus sp. MIT S9508]